VIPVLAVVGFRTKRGRRPRLWIPLILLWLLLLPIVIPLLLVFVVVCLAARWPRPLRSLWVGWQILAALRGTAFEVDTSETSILVHIL
jgi:hypothetical protein